MAKRKSSRRSGKNRFVFFHFSFKVLLIICASALVAGYLSAVVNPETFFPFTLFGLYFTPIAAVNLILLIMALLRRSSSFWIPFMALLPALFLFRFVYQFSGEAVPVEKGEIKVLTYNVGGFVSGKDGMDSDDSREAVMKLIDENQPDIVCLQEYTVRDTMSIRRCFHGYGYVCHHFFRHEDGMWSGNLTVSKLPVTSTGVLEFKDSRNMSLWCDVIFGDRQWRVFNNHLESNSISLTALIKKIGSRDRDIGPEIERIHEKLKVSVARRSHQTTEILANINAGRKPSLVCGDFNDMPLSYTFRHLCRGRKDSFVEAGCGFGATYSVLWPLLRIDYVLLPRQTDIRGHETLRVPYSDHYPVITRFMTNDENNQ